MSNLQTFEALVDALVLDPQFELKNKEFITRAIDEFEESVPNQSNQTVSVLSTGENEFDFPSGADIGWGIDGLISVEYPIMGSGDTYPNFIFVSSQWTNAPINSKGMFLYQDNANITSVKLRFRSTLTVDFKVGYRKKYTVSDTASDVPVMHEHKVAKLAASMKAGAIGQRYLSTKNFTRAEDLINFATNGRDYMTVSKQLRGQYEDSVAPFKFKIHPQTVETIVEYPRLAR